MAYEKGGQNRSPPNSLTFQAQSVKTERSIVILFLIIR